MPRIIVLKEEICRALVLEKTAAALENGEGIIVPTFSNTFCFKIAPLLPVASAELNAIL